MLFYIKQMLLLMTGLAAVGYLRSGIGNRPNTLLVNLGDKARHWLAEDTVIARFSLLFLPLLVLYNFLAWSVFGLQSIVEFILAGVKWIWWLLTWVWNEVLHPTVFAFFRLLWHYLAVMSWRLFEFGFSPIRRSVATDNLVHAARRLIILFLLLGALAAVVLLTSLVYVAIPAALIAFFLTQHAQFRILQHLEPARFPEPNLQTARNLTALWFGISVLGAGLMALVIYFNRSAIVQGLGVSVTQAGVVLAVLAGSAFASATNCLPAHLEESGGSASLLTYLKAILWRLPKLIYGQLFAFHGLIVVSLVPLIVFSVLNLAIDQVTGLDVRGWLSEISEIRNIPPGIENDLEAIEKLEADSVKLEGEKAEAMRLHDKEITTAKNRLVTHERLLAAIKDRQIHTMLESPLTGDEQFFSIPPIPSTTAYDWQIRESDGDRVTEFTVQAREGESSVIEYRWTKEGEYIVSVAPRNSCGKGEGITRQVTVTKAVQSYFTIPPPVGKTVVCSGEEVNYSTRAGSGHYEWQIPSDASISSDPNQNKIMVKFGNQSGTIRVRAADAEGRYSLWTGVDVEVIPTPGYVESRGRFVEDEQADERKRPRAFVFRTREAGKGTVAALKKELADRKSEKEVTLKSFNEKIHQTQVEIAALSREIRMMLFRLVGNLLALAGLALLAGVILAAPMLYALQYQFELYGFAQQGKHYWEELLANIRARNAHQPLLGIFVLLVAYGVWKVVTGPVPDLPDLTQLPGTDQ